MYRFLRKQVRWSGIPIFFKNFPVCCDHTVKGFSIVNEAEVDVFFWNSLAFSMIQRILADSSAFSKSSLYVWKFSVHILSKPRLEDFEHDLASM